MEAASGHKQSAGKVNEKGEIAADDAHVDEEMNERVDGKDKWKGVDRVAVGDNSGGHDEDCAPEKKKDEVVEHDGDHEGDVDSETGANKNLPPKKASKKGE